MRNKVIIAVVLIALVALLGIFISRMDTDVPHETESSLEESVALAEEWIRSYSPTYLFDGSDLEFVYGEEIEEDVFELYFEFISSAAGYGERTDQMLAQVITSHTVEVVVDDMSIVSVITDGVYDEKYKEMLEEENTEVNLYYLIVEENIESVVPVTREIPSTEGIARETLVHLLSGPTEEEINEGYTTAINDGVEILSIYIDNNVAYVDFSSELDTSGSAMTMAVRDQITNTLMQFETVEEVVISIEGNNEEVLQP